MLLLQLDYILSIFYLDIIFFSSTPILTLYFLYIIVSNRNCRTILHYLKTSQKIILIFWPLDLFACLFISWLLELSFSKFYIEAILIPFGLTWELWFYHVITKMCEWEESGEIYCFDKHGQMIYNSDPLDSSIDIDYICDTVEVKEVQAWPAGKH